MVAAAHVHAGHALRSQLLPAGYRLKAAGRLYDPLLYLLPGFYVEGLVSKEVDAHSQTMGFMHRALSHRQVGPAALRTCHMPFSPVPLPPTGIAATPR